MQIGLSVDTLYGVFPLTRFVSDSLFANSLVLGTYELIDDPTVIASTSGVALMIEALTREWKAIPQVDVVFSSNPIRPDLENEALYLFNANPKFFVHTRREIVEALLKGEHGQRFLESFDRQEFDSNVRGALFDAFGTNGILFVRVNRMPTEPDDAFYLVSAQHFERDRDDPTRVLFNMGFARDRTQWAWPLVGANIVLMGLALALAVILYLRRADGAWRNVPGPDHRRVRCVPFGSGFPVVHLSDVENLHADPGDTGDRLMVVSGPGMRGHRLDSDPVDADRDQRFPSVMPLSGFEGLSRYLGLGVGVGAGAYWLTPLVLFEGAPPVFASIGAIAALAVLGFGFARSFERGSPVALQRAWAIVASIGTPLVGVAISRGTTR